MKVMCIEPYYLSDNSAYPTVAILTLGKIYNVINISHAGENIIISDKYYRIIDDSGKKCWVIQERFKRVDIIREEKLKELGI